MPDPHRPRPVASLAAILALALSSIAVPAQKHESSPPGFLTTEGPGSSSSFGTFPAARHMFFDGGLGQTRAVLIEVDFRVDYRIHARQLEVGRSWTRITLDLAECSFRNLSQTFSRNPTSTPTRVFSSPLSWRELYGLPVLQPAAWGTLYGELRFPFTRPWIHTGARDVCLDFDFTGGVLTNTGAWPETTQREYHLDGFDTPPVKADSISTPYGKSLTGGGCIDSKSTIGWGGYTGVTATTYSLVSPTNPGQFLFKARSMATANGVPAVHAWSLGGSGQGTAVPGVACNRLHLDLQSPTVYLTKVGPPPYAWVDYQFGPFPYTDPLGNLPVWLQVAWADSGNGNLMLSSASRIVVPKMPPSVLRSCLYQPLGASKASTGIGPSGATELNPIWRYVMQ